METVTLIDDGDDQIVLLPRGVFEDGEDVRLEKLADGSVVITPLRLSPAE